MARGILYTFVADANGGYDTKFETTVIDIEYSAIADSDAALTEVINQSLSRLPKQDASGPFFVAFVSGDTEVFSLDKGKVAKINVAKLGVVEQEDVIPQGPNQMIRTPVGPGRLHLRRPQNDDDQNPNQNAVWQYHELLKDSKVIGGYYTSNINDPRFKNTQFKQGKDGQGVVYYYENLLGPDEYGDILIVNEKGEDYIPKQLPAESIAPSTQVENFRSSLVFMGGSTPQLPTVKGAETYEGTPVMREKRNGKGNSGSRPASKFYGGESGFSHTEGTKSEGTVLSLGRHQQGLINARKGFGPGAPYDEDFDARLKLQKGSNLRESSDALRLLQTVPMSPMLRLLDNAPGGLKPEGSSKIDAAWLRRLSFSGSHVVSPIGASTPLLREAGPAAQEQDDYKRACDIFSTDKFQKFEMNLLRDLEQEDPGGEDIPNTRKKYILNTKQEEWIESYRCNKNVAHFLALFVENKYYQDVYKELRDQNQQLGDHKKELDDSNADQILKHNASSAKDRIKIRNLKNDFKAHKDDLLSQHKADLDSLQKELSKENRRLQEVIKNLKDELSRSQENNLKLREEHLRTLARIAKENQGLISKLKVDHEAEKAKINDENDSLSKENKRLQEQLDKATKKIISLNTKLTEALAAQKAAEEATVVAQEYLRALNKELKDVKEELAMAKLQKTKKIQASAVKIPVDTAKIAELEANVKWLVEEVDRLKKEALKKADADRQSVLDFKILAQSLAEQTALAEQFQVATQAVTVVKGREEAYQRELTGLEAQVKLLETAAGIVTAVVAPATPTSAQGAQISFADVSAKFRALKDRLKAAEDAFVAKLGKKDQDIAILQGQRDAAVVSQTTAAQQLVQALATNASSTKKSDKDDKEIARLTAANAALINQVADFTAQIAQLTSEKDYQAKTIRDLKKKIAEQLATITTLTANLAKEQRDRAVEKEALEGRILEADAANQRLDIERKYLQAEQTASDQAAAAHAVAIVAAQEERNVAVTALAQANADHAAALARVGGDADGDKAALRARIKELTDIVTARELTIATLKQQLEAEQAKNLALTQQVAALVAKRDAALAREAALKARVQELTDENIALKLGNEALAATMTALQQENFELATNFTAKTRENQEKADKLAAQALLLEAEAQKVAAAEAKLVANQAATDAATVGLANVAEALTIVMGGSREKVRADGNDAADEAEVVVAVALVSGAINAPRLVDGRDDIIAGLKRDLQALLDAGKEKTSLVASAAGLDTTSTSPKKGGVWRGFLNVFSGGGGKKKDKKAASGAIAAVPEVNDGDVSEHSAEADQSLQARIADLLAQIAELEKLQKAGPVMAHEVDALVQELKARLGNTVALTDNEVRLRRDLEDSKAALTVLQAQYDKDKAAWQTEREQMQGQINAFTVRVDAAEKEAADAQATSVEDKAARLDAERKLATLQNALEAPESEKPLSEVARNQGEYISVEERSAVNPDPELQHLKIDNQLKLERIEKLEKQLQLAIITAKLVLAAGNEGVVETAQAGGERLSQPAVATLADTAIERPSAQEQTYMGRLQNLDGRLKMLVDAGVDDDGYPKKINYQDGEVVYVENQDGGFVGIFTPKDDGSIQIVISNETNSNGSPKFVGLNDGKREEEFLNLDNAINLLLQAQQAKLASDTEALRYQQAELQRQRDEFESEKEVFAQMKELDTTKYSAAVPTLAITATVGDAPKAKTTSSAKKNGVTWGSAEYITTKWGTPSTMQYLYKDYDSTKKSFQVIDAIGKLIHESKMDSIDKNGVIKCIANLKMLLTKKSDAEGSKSKDITLEVPVKKSDAKAKEPEFTIAGLIYKGTYTGNQKRDLSLLDYVNKYNDLAVMKLVDVPSKTTPPPSSSARKVTYSSLAGGRTPPALEK